jgi:hypothetical protein
MASISMGGPELEQFASCLTMSMKMQNDLKYSTTSVALESLYCRIGSMSSQAVGKPLKPRVASLPACSLPQFERLQMFS